MARDEESAKTASGVSRRTFLRGGAAGALAGGLLPAGSGARAATAADATEQPVGPGAVEVTLEVNGKSRTVAVEPRVTLLDALRDRLDVTGPKKVCDRATCGACSVQLDGSLVYACSILAVEADGKRVTTVEGLGTPDELHPVQAAFVENDAQQCGFCTSGLVLASATLLERNPNPTAAEVSRALSGNLCRCGTYGGIHGVLLGKGEVG